MAVQMKGVKGEVKKEYIEYGNILLTTAVIAIILTAPLGAILINTLGVKWLSHDAEDPEDDKTNIVAVAPEVEMAVVGEN